jgi:hypothetical protein
MYYAFTCSYGRIIWNNYCIGCLSLSPSADQKAQFRTTVNNYCRANSKQLFGLISCAWHPSHRPNSEQTTLEKKLLACFEEVTSQGLIVLPSALLLMFNSPHRSSKWAITLHYKFTVHIHCHITIIQLSFYLITLLFFGATAQSGPGPPHSRGF